MALQTKTISANGSNGHHKFTLNISEDSTNVNTNNSWVSWTFVLSPIGTGWDWSYSNTKPVEYTVTVNGVVKSGVIYNYNGSSTITVDSGGFMVAHNADGSKSISFSFSVTSLNQSYLPGSASSSGTMTLTRIPRAATIVTAPNFKTFENPTITYSNPAGNAVTSLKACISYTGADDIKYRDIPKTGTSYTFELTDDERWVLINAITSGTSVSVKFYVTTVIGGQTFYSTLSRTFSLNPSEYISFTPVVDDTNTKTRSLTGGGNKMVRYMSNAGCLLRSSPSFGAQLVEYSAKNGSQVSTGDDFLVINNVESDTFDFFIKDSRGNTAETSLKVDLIPYTKLTCSLKVTPPDTNGSVKYTISGKYFNDSFGIQSNGLFLVLWYSEEGKDESVIEISKENVTISGDSYTYEGTITGLNYKNTYTFHALAEDSLLVIETQSITVTGKPVFDWGKDDFHFGVDVFLDNNKAINGTLADETVIPAIVPCNENGHLMIGAGQYLNGKNTNIYGENINLTGYVTVNNRGFGQSKVLWEGALTMQAGAKAELSESPMLQPHGIVLVFSLYRNGRVEDVSINSFFVSKEEISLLPGAPHTFFMGINAGFSTIAAKYLYIYGDSILGHEGNTSSGTNSGITYDNSKFVLRYVIGV